MLGNSAHRPPSVRAKNPRVFISTSKKAIAPDVLNQLFHKAGLPVRPPDKLRLALQHSRFCIAAKSLREKKLLGFVRAAGDGVFNITVWDLVVDPDLPNPKVTKRLLLSHLTLEVKRTIPNCTISMLASSSDHEILRQVDFSENEEGICAMVWQDNAEELNAS